MVKKELAFSECRKSVLTTEGFFGLDKARHAIILLYTEKLITSSSVEIFATDIKSNPFNGTVDLHYKTFDLRDTAFTEWVESIKPEKVIHLASILQLSATMTREQAYEIDVIATEKLLATCVSIAVEKFIITTSGAVYGYYEENAEEITEQRQIR